jgi:hypothetical protein
VTCSVLCEALHLDACEQSVVFFRENRIISGDIRTLLGHMNSMYFELRGTYTRGVHTSVRLSQTARRNPSCARASREEDGLPRPRQSTLGDCTVRVCIASRRSSGKNMGNRIGQTGADDRCTERLTRAVIDPAGRDKLLHGIGQQHSRIEAFLGYPVLALLARTGGRERGLILKRRHIWQSTLVRR